METSDDAADLQRYKERFEWMVKYCAKIETTENGLFMARWYDSEGRMMYTQFAYTATEAVDEAMGRTE